MKSNGKYEIPRLNSEYSQLLGSIRSNCDQLNSPRDTKLCLLWLAKLNDATSQEKTLRNRLLAQLQEDVMQKKLRHPFSREPPDGPLSSVMQGRESSAPCPSKMNINIQMRNPYYSSPPGFQVNYSSYPSSNLTSQSVGTSSFESKYRSKEHKATVSRLKGELAELFSPTTNNSHPAYSDASFNPSEQSFHRSASHFDNGMKPQKVNVRVLQGPDELRERIHFLEEQNRQLTSKCQQLQGHNLRNVPSESTATAKVAELQRQLSQSQQYQERVLDHFKTQLREVIFKRNEAISNLETHFRNSHTNSTMMVSEVEKSMLDQCEKLERKYKLLLETAAEEHSKESRAQRRNMYDLMGKLYPSSTGVSTSEKKKSTKTSKVHHK